MVFIIVRRDLIFLRQNFMLDKSSKTISSILSNKYRELCTHFSDVERKLGNGTESSDESSESENEEKFKEDTLHHQILNASLPFVHIHGWSKAAISQGAESLGYSQMAHGMFDGAGTDLVNYFYTLCNNELEEQLRKIVSESEQNPERKLSTTEFIRNATEIRLRMNADYIDSWSQALVLHCAPGNLPKALGHTGTLVDDIWYYAGDRSPDFTWYQKRVILATVYKSTEICMLQDKSDDFKETWLFLDRCLQQIKTIDDCVKKAESSVKDVEWFGKAGLITALNIFGLNSTTR